MDPEKELSLDWDRSYLVHMKCCLTGFKEAHCLLGAERALQLLDCLFITLQTKLVVSRMCKIIIEKEGGGGGGFVSPWIRP